MRNLLLILLAALLPMQWSYAAVAELCDERAPGYVHVVDAAPGAVRAGARVARSHDAQEPGHDARAHGVHAHGSSGHVSAAASDDVAATLEDSAAADADCPAVAHHGACCHVVAAALPAPASMPYPFAGAAPAMPVPVLPALSHASDGPFRPPRTVTA